MVRLGSGECITHEEWHWVWSHGAARRVQRAISLPAMVIHAIASVYFFLPILDCYADGTKPGEYIIKESLDDRLCENVRDKLNDSNSFLYKQAKIFPENFVRWSEVKNLDKTTTRTVDPGDLQETSIDIDNDGRSDRIFRWKASLGGIKSAHLFIFSSRDSLKLPVDNMTIQDLSNASRQLFINGSTWIQSVQRKHTQSWVSWTAGFISNLEIFRYGDLRYILAFTPQSPPDVSMTAIVLQLFPENETKGLCMYYRLCPCSGCRDLRGDQVKQFLPSKMLCGG